MPPPVVVGKHCARGVQHQPRRTAAKLLHWFTANAVCNGPRYMDREIPWLFQLEGYAPAWCADITLLHNIAKA